MKKSEIEVGGEYAVYVEGIDTPRGTGYPTGNGGEVAHPEHAQVWRHVPLKESYRNKRDIVRGKVVALNVDRVTSEGGWSRYYSLKSDGVLVEFPEPVAIDTFTRHSLRDNPKATSVTTAVVTTKHILEPWVIYAETQDAAENAERKQRAENDRLAAAFAPVLDATIQLLDAAGLGPVIEDESLNFNGGTLRIDTQRGTEGWVRTGFERKASIDAETLLCLLRVDNAARSIYGELSGNANYVEKRVLGSVLGIEA